MALDAVSPTGRGTSGLPPAHTSTHSPRAPQLMPKRAILALKAPRPPPLLLPFAYLLQLYRSGALALDPDPVNYITHFTGDWALWILLGSLAITPLRRLSPRSPGSSASAASSASTPSSTPRSTWRHTSSSSPATISPPPSPASASGHPGQILTEVGRSLAHHPRRPQKAPLHPGRPPRLDHPARPRGHQSRPHPPRHGRQKLAAPPPPRLRRRNRRSHPLLVAGQNRRPNSLESHRYPHRLTSRPPRLRRHQTPQQARSCTRNRLILTSPAPPSAHPASCPSSN